MANGENKVNERIAQAVAERGKRRLYIGERDATFRFGKNIPYETPANFSAGYTGKAIIELSEEFTEGRR